ncbi:MAG: nucleotidyltransferase family protein [Patescibacteria group bacterium]
MQAVILAAGAGVRMRPLTYEVPKPMLPVQGKPLLAYSIEQLPKEIDEVILVVGYLGEQLKKYFGNEYDGRQISYVIQPELLGTGDALWRCRGLLKGRFLVLMGDDIYQAKDVVRCLAQERCILAKEVVAEELRNYGALMINEAGNLIDIVETELMPGTKCLVNSALYVLDENVFKYSLAPIKDGKEFGLPQTVVKMVNGYPVKIVQTDYWLPIGYPDDLKRAEIYLRKQGLIK